MFVWFIAMALMGLLEPVWRLPMCPPKESTREAMRAALEELELLP
jgi:dihydrodipicolinate synthase/N-acetylneuraminate lyase